PSTVRIDVETMQTLTDVPVAPLLEGLNLAAPAVADPPVVSVRAPRRVIERLNALEGGPRVVARLSESALRSIQEGVEVRREAGLRLPEGMNGAERVRITPDKAMLSFQVQSRTASVTVTAPVWVHMPPFEQDRWRVDLAEQDEVLRDLRITGPSDLIAPIAEGRQAVIATLSLTSDDLDQRITSKQVVFMGLPPGVTVEGAEEPVRFTIEARGAGAAPGG
ncbi:MAG: hypothetical protein VYC34_12360, partial [Planctomycetota bacterium]|nr:hypothetical protein [Planctomycetota bacterium]